MLGEVNRKGCADGHVVRSMFCLVRSTGESVFGQSTIGEEEVDGTFAKAGDVLSIEILVTQDEDMAQEDTQGCKFGTKDILSKCSSRGHM